MGVKIVIFFDLVFFSFALMQKVKNILKLQNGIINYFMRCFLHQHDKIVYKSRIHQLTSPFTFQLSPFTQPIFLQLITIKSIT